MPISFEDLRVLQNAEGLADRIWRLVLKWKPFPKDVMGKQLTRAADSIGANIAESYGRFHYGEKLNFLYYARGSLYETKYWLKRARERSQLSPIEFQELSDELTQLARQINSFATTIKRNRTTTKRKEVKEIPIKYETGDENMDIFSPEEIMAFKGHNE